MCEKEISPPNLTVAEMCTTLLRVPDGVRVGVLDLDLMKAVGANLRSARS